MKNLKLMIVGTSTSADVELVKFLAQQTGLEVVMLTEGMLQTLRTPGLSNDAKLAAFNVILGVKPSTNPEADNVNWSVINQLEHNKEVDENG